MPPAKAVGRLAARRVAQSIAQRLGGDGAPKPGASSQASFVGELAQEIASEYASDLKRGSELGPLADLVDAVKGPTSKMASDLKSVGAAISAAAPRASAQLSGTYACACDRCIAVRSSHVRTRMPAPNPTPNPGPEPRPRPQPRPYPRPYPRPQLPGSASAATLEQLTNQPPEGTLP